MEIPWSSLSAVPLSEVLVGLFVVAILRGLLVPRSILEDTRADRDSWREESRVKDQMIAEKDKQLDALAEVGETQKSVLQALARMGERE